MEKILVSSYDEFVKFNTDTNSIRPVSDGEYDTYLRSFVVASEDGQVISTDEVIDVKAGDLIFIFRIYDEELHRERQRILVVSDPTVKHDMEQIMQFCEEIASKRTK